MVNLLLTLPFSFLLGTTISVFIHEHLWENPQQVYLLAILIGIDLFTGIWKAFKFKRFRSRRISRTVGKTITYSIVLYIAHNLDMQMGAVFFWMPFSCLSVFYATEAWSIIENLGEIGYLDLKYVKYLKDKLNLVNYININEEDEKIEEEKAAAEAEAQAEAQALILNKNKDKENDI